MRTDTVFRIASLAKPVTAVAAMILLEECRLRLDESIEPWLPELANRRVLRSLSGPLDDTVPAHRPITVRDPQITQISFWGWIKRLAAGSRLKGLPYLISPAI